MDKVTSSTYHVHQSQNRLLRMFAQRWMCGTHRKKAQRAALFRLCVGSCSKAATCRMGFFWVAMEAQSTETGRLAEMRESKPIRDTTRQTQLVRREIRPVGDARKAERRVKSVRILKPKTQPNIQPDADFCKPLPPSKMARRSAPPHSGPAYYSGASRGAITDPNESSFSAFLRTEVFAPEKIPGNLSIVTGAVVFFGGIAAIRTWGDILIPA